MTIAFLFSKRRLYENHTLYCMKIIQFLKQNPLDDALLNNFS